MWPRYFVPVILSLVWSTGEPGILLIWWQDDSRVLLSWGNDERLGVSGWPFLQKIRLSNLTSGLLNLCRSVILAFPFNVRFVSTGPFVVYFDEDGADQAFE